MGKAISRYAIAQNGMRTCHVPSDRVQGAQGTDMGTRKSAKKPEKKSFLSSLFAGFGGGNKAKDAKKKPGNAKKGPPSKKGGTLAKKAKVAAALPDDDFMADDFLNEEDSPTGFVDATVPAAMSTAPPRPVPQPERRPAASAEPPAAGSGLFGPEGVDNALDSLFDSFGVPSGPSAQPEPQAPAFKPEPAYAPPASHAPEPAYAPEPAFAPEPPRAPAPPPAPAAAPPQDGLVSIGKLLVDQNTLKRIIDNAEKRGSGLYTTTRVISNSKGADLDNLLVQIDSCSGVAGSMIVGRDGLVIASTLPAPYDKDLVGAIASSMQTNLDVQCKKMRLGAARQIILDTEQGVVLLVALEIGVLVVMSQSLVGLDLTGVLSVVAGVADNT